MIFAGKDAEVTEEYHDENNPDRILGFPKRIGAGGRPEP